MSTESGDIMRMLGSAWDGVGGAANVTLYPEPLRAEIDSLNEWIATRINDGVYGVGTATAQVVYGRAHRKLLEALDEIEQRLAGSRFLFGDEPVEATGDCFRHSCASTRCTRELYRRPGIAATVRHDEILRHYYRSFPALNPNGIVPLLDSPDFAALSGHIRGSP